MRGYTYCQFFKVSGDLKGSSHVIKQEYIALGNMSLAERKVLVIVISYAFGFIFRDKWSSFLGVSNFVKDSTVAFFAAVVLFSLSSGRKNKGVELSGC